MAKKFDSIKEAQLEFALKLLQLQHNETTTSTVFSPVSIAIALATAYLGADGNTAEEIKNALAGGFTESQIQSHFTTLLKNIKRKYAVEKLPSPGPEVDSADEEAYEARQERLNDIRRSSARAVLEAVNLIYVKKDANLEDSFVETFKKLYQGGLDMVDFTEASTVEKINEFVEEVTHGKVENLVTEDSFNKATKILFINSIYFKGRWAYEFNRYETKDDIFYSAPGKTKKVKMMEHGVERWQFSENDKFYFLSLPYLLSEISMKIILPKERFGLEDIIKNLTAAELNKHLKSKKQAQVIVRMPRFEVNSKFDAVNTLQNMGIKDLFGTDANLTKMTADKEMFISTVFHTAFIYTDEEGTEAAAVTRYTLVGSCALPPEPIEFTADHPFLFLITDKKNHLYFCGTVTGSEFKEYSTTTEGRSNEQEKGPAKKRKKN